MVNTSPNIWRRHVQRPNSWETFWQVFLLARMLLLVFLHIVIVRPRLLHKRVKLIMRKVDVYIEFNMDANSLLHTKCTLVYRNFLASLSTCDSWLVILVGEAPIRRCWTCIISSMETIIVWNLWGLLYIFNNFKILVINIYGINIFQII